MKPQHPVAEATPAKARSKKAMTAASAAGAPTTAAPSIPVREDFIREAAYYRFEARGSIGGHELEDWLRAEAEFERLHSDGTPKVEAAPDAH